MTANPSGAGRGPRQAAGIYGDGTYLDNNRTWHVEDSPWKARQIAALLDLHKLRPATVCEVGCGAGEILRQLSARYPAASFDGYELSPQAFELCKERASAKVRYHLRNVLDENVFYDCLLCIDVLEHVEDPMGFLKALKSVSTYKVFHIPLDISVLSVLRSTLMDQRRIVGHLHYFTRETALATLTECGYEVVDSRYTTSFSDLPSPTLRAKLARLPRILLYSLSPDWAVRLLGGCSLLVLAK